MRQISSGRIWASVFFLALLGGVPVVWAGEGFFHSLKRDATRNNCWPDAFVPGDRATVRIPFVIMVSRGWMKQNLIGDHLFDESGTMLNEAGRRQVHWIVTQAPLPHRTIYVKKTLDEGVTQARVNAVLSAAQEVLPPDQKVDIRVTDIEPPGWPAEYVDQVERSFLKTMPEPRLPPRATSSNDGGTLSSN